MQEDCCVLLVQEKVADMPIMRPGWHCGMNHLRISPSRSELSVNKGVVITS